MGYYYWTKKIDNLHLHHGNSSTTLCGKPMLGTNYQAEFPDRELCPKCLEIVEKEMPDLIKVKDKRKGE